MTKVRKQKRKKRFRANVNRKRLRNKLQKLPKIECEEIEDSWETKRSIRTNLKDMGLAYNPNEALKIPSTKRGIIKIGRIDGDVVDHEGEEEISENPQGEKIHVANKLEADAKAPRERMFKLPKSQIQFVTYLMEKYGDDYKAMARDRKNYYQMTWCQIRAKINSFKSIPEQYAEYLLKSGEIVLDDPTPLEETRRKIGEENVKKYCAPKKRKLVSKEPKPVWEIDSLEDNENEEEIIGIKEKNSSNDSNNENKVYSDNGLKKLKLFSDDELSDADENNTNNKVKGLKKKGKMLLKAKENSKEQLESNQTSKKIDLESKKNENSVESLKKLRKNVAALQKSNSSDSSDDEFEGDGEAEGFVNLSDMSEEELSEEDILDDGEFVTDSEDESE